MPELAPAAMAMLLFLTTTAVAAQTPGTMSAERGWSAIAHCAQEDSERARHACLDRVLRDAGLLTNEMRARQQRRAFGLDDKPARTPTPQHSPAPPAATAANSANSTTSAASATAKAPETAASSATALATAATSKAAATSATPPTAATASAGTPAAPPKTLAPSPAAAPAGPPDRLEVELAKVEKAVNGRLFVTTTDGAVWLQNESVQMPQPPVAGDRMTIRKGSMGGYRCSVASTHLTYRCVRNR